MRRSFIRFCVYLVGYMCYAQASAQDIQLSGTITDGTSESKLVGASVSIPSDNAGTYTDGDGKYALTISPKGRSEIVVKYAFTGFTTIEKTILLTPGQDIIQDISLEPAGYTTESVVLTATKGFQQDESDLTVSISVVKPQFVDLQATPSVETVIEQIPGVELKDDQVDIRGSSGFAYGVGSRVMVALDGLPLLTGDAQSPAFDLIPVDNIAQVEVLKGASSVLYGSAAMGGVINVLTNDPADTAKTRIRLRAGVFDTPCQRPPQERSETWPSTAVTRSTSTTP
ncbi:MAG: TonB-dependent receptor plug domain-containing protein, partial [Bacteroidota bacterium]